MLKQRSAEKGQNTCEQAAREYEERKVRQAALTDRVAQSVERVVTAAMVRALENYKRDVCGKGRRAVTSAILMAAEEQGMRVEV